MVFFENYFHPKQQMPTTSGSTGVFFKTTTVIFKESSKDLTLPRYPYKKSRPLYKAG
ncbi:MAG TPA: hypothetical protein PL063_01105 [Candidatus Cloacimonadota bacterium]|jgi:hypothetical protein|nr:hypothetical protein [Candidatus Cloacimonadales bacterium]HPY95790.1 hypothetical protein [Candidatus Cloacimonadota bacterium]HQB40320.1 hypothetical protein [Candidatus Cloacimonadota bacterium]